jgi:hypothetical protein
MFVVHFLIDISYITWKGFLFLQHLMLILKKIDHHVLTSLQQTYKPFTCSLLHFISAKLTQLTSLTPLDS